MRCRFDPPSVVNYAEDTMLKSILSSIRALPALFRPRENIDWRDANAPGRVVTVDGVGVHYLEQGAGPAVVLVHGYGGHTYTYRYLIPELARDHRVVALDLKGFGYSERPRKSDYSISAQARLVARFMDALDIQQASLVGHSMGGEVAMRVAAGWPERTDRIVLAGSISGERFPSLPLLPILKPIFGMLARLFGHRLLKRMFYDPRHATREVLQAYRAPARIRGSADAAFNVVRHARRDKTVDYKRITQQVLILWASYDRIVPRWVLGRLRKHFPRAEVIEIERAGHLLLEEQPSACNEAIRSFLTERKRDDAATQDLPRAVDIGRPAS